MLHINKIVVKNFRPYYGTQTFDFKSDDGVSIILGDNGVGKTSLIKALKFVLYDEFDSTHAFKIKNELNNIAWEEQTFDMYVSLDFKYNDDDFILKRSVRNKPDVSIPMSDVDFQKHLTLVKNGKIQSQSESNIILQNIIPKQISEYILFEGETISKYKDLLDNDRNKEIYESIRKILGINILENSQHDLEKQLSLYENERVKLIKERSHNEKLLKQIDSLTEQKDNYTKEKLEASNNLNDAFEQRKVYIEKLKNNQRTSELLQEEAATKAEIHATEKSIIEDKNDIKILLKDYKSFSKGVVSSIIEKTPPEITNIRKYIESNLAINNELNTLRTTIEVCECIICGNTISEKEKETINNKISSLKSKIIEIKEKDRDLLLSYELETDRLKKLLSEIKDYDSSNKINVLEIKIQSKLIAKDRLDRKIKSISSQLETLGGIGDLEQVTKAYTLNEKNIAIYRDTIDRCEEKLKEIHKNLDNVIKKNPAQISTSSIDSKIHTTKLLISIFQKAIDIYSDKVRIKVQEDATMLFRGISENKEYDRLEFDSHYGLKLIDNKGRIVPNISSGYMTLITISLIYGLHKNSSLAGTIVLDAPFSVLTDVHRDNIIKTFQNLSPQVILLVYKDQINIEDARAQMASKLINEYEIYQNKEDENYSYKTKIRRI